MSALMSNGLGGGLLGLGLAFLLAVALVPLGIRLAWRFGVVDHPVGNKIHARPTPLMGGAAMAASFLVVTLLFPRHWPNQALVGLLVGCALATLLGFGHAPDNVAHAVTLVAGILFTVFWIVGMMNTVNLLDGLDGLAGGVAAIAALFLGLWAWHMAGSGYVTRDEQNVILPLILCGALLGFLVYNWTPARVFMGDSGAMFIGFALGALSIFGPVKLGTALLLLIVPIVDVAWAIVRRLLGRRSFASGDKHHIYHRMLELGMSRRSVVLAFYALCIALGVLDLLLVKKQKLAADAVVAVLAAASAVALEVRGRRAEARTRRPRTDYQVPTPKR